MGRHQIFFRTLFVLSLALGQIGFAEAPAGCPSEIARARKAAWGYTHLPESLDEVRERELVDEFSSDGRPILIVTDTRERQRSGVVTTLKTIRDQIVEISGGKVPVVFMTPDEFPGFEFPYQDLRIARMSRKKFAKRLEEINPQAIHIPVEGPLGTQARSYLVAHGIGFTTAYHTEFPDYVAAAIAPYLPPLAEPARRWTQSHLKRFHRPSKGLMVSTQTLFDKLIAEGYEAGSLRKGSRGVDAKLFNREARNSELYAGLTGPISVYVGRVAAEKNIEDFLKMNIPGTKVVVGGGPELESLRAKYPKVKFFGKQDHDQLPKFFASADAFVFPSLTDTFGLVQLEALACGIPVVAYNVAGPKDVITSAKVGALALYDPNGERENVDRLTEAWYRAIGLDPADCRAFAEQRTWKRTTLEFLHFLHRLPVGLLRSA